MDYSSMMNERKRHEMEMEMNRFEQEISSRPVFNNFVQSQSLPQSHVQQSAQQSVPHFIPHQIQKQMPRPAPNASHQQTQFEGGNYGMPMMSSQTHLGGHVNYTVTPMAMPSVAHQTNVAGIGVSVQSAVNKKSKTNTGEKGKKQKKMLRMAGGTIWEDNSLQEWDGGDFRIFCGDLGNDVTDDVLARAFNRFPSFLKAKVIRDKRSNKTKGFGFVSFKDPQDFTRAMKEMNGKYVGSRPIKLRKSTWRERNLDAVRKKNKEKAKLGLL